MEEQLIFILIPKFKWANYVVYPCCVTDSGEFYSYKGKYTDNGELSEEGRRILHLCDRCEIASLYDSFGRKKYKTEREFTEKMSGQVLDAVKSFVAKTVAEIIRRLASRNTALFLRESRLQSIYKQDAIHLLPEPLKPLLGFYRDSEKIRYTLRLAYGEKIFVPMKCGLKVITDSPCIVLIGDRLYSLPEKFGGLRLLPFLKKEEIIIPRHNEREYFRKFILKNVYSSEIEVEGFDVVYPQCTKTCVLSLENNIVSEPILSVEFYYNQRLVRFSDSKRVIVEMKEEGDDYCFYKIVRDVEWEKSFLDFLKTLGLVESTPGNFIWPENNNWGQMIDWIALHRSVLEQQGITISQKKLSAFYYTGKWTVNYSEERELDWFQLRMEVILEDGRKISLQDMRECILSGKRAYPIDENTVFIIPEEWFARYTGLFLFGQSKRDKLLLHRSQLSLVNAGGEANFRVNVTNNTLETVAVPVSLRAVLRDYQQRGFEWLYHLYRQGVGACLADDMGLGKTIQTIALLLKYKEETRKSDGTEMPKQLDLFAEDLFAGQENDKAGEVSEQAFFKTCLIIAPASVVHNWKNELAKFAPSLTTLVYTGSGIFRSEKRKALLRWDTVVTTYQTFRNDIDFFIDHHFGVVVFDESQNFKNRSSLLHQAVAQVRGDFYIALSGTPIENSLSDLWSLMEVINSGLLGSHASFQNYFIRPIEADNQGIRSQMLHKLIAPYILRRTKEEVLQDLPERMDEVILCEPDKEQKQVYEEELSRTRNLIMEKSVRQERGGGQIVILQSLNRLRQIANHPLLAVSDYLYGSGKFREVFRMLEEVAGTGHKVLLFSDYVSFLNLIGKEMKIRGWDYAMLTGETQNREEVINRFSATADCHFFLISLKAGGVGLNLTEADYVFILDPWWNVAAEEQAISRAHRMGQKRSVFVYRFITEGTLEEKIQSMQKDKQSLVDAVIKSGI